MEQFPGVAILILNWNNYQDTKSCLESLDKLSYPNRSIVLVDNGSSDKSGVKLAAEYQEAHTIFTGENLGFAAGNNVGLRYILDRDIPYVLLLNNDTEVINPDFLQELIQEISVETDIAAVGPRVHRYDSSCQDTILPYPTLWVTILNTLGLYRNDLTKKQFVDSISGCCVLVKSKAISQVGYLDENFFFYGEETEWFYRIRRNGWKIAFFPVDSILHQGAASAKKLVNRNIYIDRRSNVIYTLVKHRQYIRAILMAALMFLLLVGRILFSLSKKSESRYDPSMIPEYLRSFMASWNLARSSTQYYRLG
jgi:GT2 family glycosyltransferase